MEIEAVKFITESQRAVHIYWLVVSNIFYFHSYLGK